MSPRGNVGKKKDSPPLFGSPPGGCALIKKKNLPPGGKSEMITVYICTKRKTSVKTSGRCITQLANMSIDPQYAELKADVLTRLYLKYLRRSVGSVGSGSSASQQHEVQQLLQSFVRVLLVARHLKRKHIHEWRRVITSGGVRPEFRNRTKSIKAQLWNVTDDHE